MNRWTLPAVLALLAIIAAVPRTACRADESENDYYRLVSLPIPKGVVLEGGGIEWMSDGRLAVSSRRGDIYMVANAGSADTSRVEFSKYASGLHEVLGLAERDGWLYATQRGELSRLKDTDDDGRADLFETVSDQWEIDGDYHEYAFGSKFDRDGRVWVVLCLTGSFNSNNKYRGWCLRIDENGLTTPTCSGIRSPGGIGMNDVGDMFYTDNQGPWNGTCSLKFLRPGSFQGHPGGNRWYDLPEVAKAMGKRPDEPKSGSRIHVEAKRIPEYEPPAILFPYKKMGQSASGVVTDTSGKFGPFRGQMFVGDQTFSTIMRCYLEKVDGKYQGACFPFREGLSSGALAMQINQQGAMFVGTTNRGWGARGGKPFSLERITWTGKTPFEIHEMHATPTGFELTFTEPIDAASANDLSGYAMESYTYIFQAAYGSPEVDRATPKITAVQVAQDRKSIRLEVETLQEGHVHELHLNSLRSVAGKPLLHKQAYYTLNRIPSVATK